jgi:hypothetical protein
MTYDPPRKDRIKGRYCDKAWHLDAGKGPVDAVKKLVCADCGLAYARCFECGLHTSVQTSMRAHRHARHSQNHALKKRVLPNFTHDRELPWTRGDK